MFKNASVRPYLPGLASYMLCRQLDVPQKTASILNRWSKHFQAHFNANRLVQESAILNIPQ